MTIEKHRKENGKTFSNSAYAQLRLASQKLQLLVDRMQGRSAKEQSRMAKVLNAVLRRFSK